MKLPSSRFTLAGPAALLVLCLCATAAVAGPQQVAQSASGVATKVEGAVKRGVKAAASGVERGAKAAGRVADKGARKLGLPAGSASAPAKTHPHGG